MSKKLIRSAFFWLVIGLILTVFMIYSDSLTGIAILAIWIAAPFCSFFQNFLIRKKISVTASYPAAVEKNKPFFGNLTVKNDSFLSVSKMLCRLKLTNSMTGETSERCVMLSAAAKEEHCTKLQLSSAHCGYLIPEITDVYLLDFIGFLPVSCKEHSKEKISVLPDTFTPEISLHPSFAMQEDADHWSPYKKGNDPSEVFALRDYVPGDSLKQIHWKLSSKRQKLIVREPSLPIENSLLIFWDKNTRAVSGKEMDAMAESMSSVCQNILEQGISFTVGWTEGTLCVFEQIDTDEQLLSVIPRMLKHGALLRSEHKTLISTDRELFSSFGKVIYLAAACPENTELFGSSEISLLLCGKEQDETVWPTIFFDADTYQEDLAIMEL